MVTKLYPIGNYAYDSAKGELNSPEGCTLERDGQIYGDAREKYPNVVRFNGEFNHYFVPANEIFGGSGNLEKKVSLDLNYIKNSSRERKEFEKTLHVLYLTEMCVGVGIILMEFFSRR